MDLTRDGRRSTRRTPWCMAGLCLLATLLASVATASGAQAHAALRSITPADGAVLTSAPTRVVLVFDEAVSTTFATVTVSGPGGAVVSSGRPVIAGATVTQALSSQLPSGAYRVTYRVVSDDGHPVADSSTFKLTVASSRPATAPATGVPSGAATTETPAGSPTAAGESSAGGDRGIRLGLAAGVGALALAAGMALVAAARRGRAGRGDP